MYRDFTFTRRIYFTRNCNLNVGAVDTNLRHNKQNSIMFQIDSLNSQVHNFQKLKNISLNAVNTEAPEGHFNLLIITYYLLLITYHLLLITYYLLLITYYLLLITYHITGPRSAVSNVSGNRCESDCRSRGRKFDPGPVPYFRGD